MRTFWTILMTALTLTLWMAPGAVLAQIAAPKLDPNIPETFSALNPATMAFNDSSRVGIGLLLDFTVDVTTGGVTSTFAEGEGKFIGFGRFVGETFSIGAESIAIDFILPGGSGDTAEFKTTYLGGSFLIGDFISIGVGQQNSEFITRAGSGFSTQTEEESLPIVGVSLKYGESIYAGLATGTESITDTSVFLGVTTINEGDRTVMRWGVAYRSRDDDSGFHLEVSQEAKDGIYDAASGFTVDEEETTTIVVEAVFSNILIGVEKFTSERTDGFNGVLNRETDGAALTLGWVPLKGFSLSISVGTEDETDFSTGNIQTQDTTFVGASWLF